jgi:hypothetical protein
MSSGIGGATQLLRRFWRRVCSPRGAESACLDPVHTQALMVVAVAVVGSEGEWRVAAAGIYRSPPRVVRAYHVGDEGEGAIIRQRYPPRCPPTSDGQRAHQPRDLWIRFWIVHFQERVAVMAREEEASGAVNGATRTLLLYEFIVYGTHQPSHDLRARRLYSRQSAFKIALCTIMVVWKLGAATVRSFSS